MKKGRNADRSYNCSFYENPVQILHGFRLSMCRSEAKKEGYMKQLIRFLFVFFIAGSLLGCASSAGQSSAGAEEKREEPSETATAESKKEEKELFDEAFLSDFSEAVQARWDAGMNAGKEDRSKEVLLKGVTVELSILEPKDYRNKEFRDAHLHEEAVNYLNALDEQKALLDGIENMETDWTRDTAEHWESIVKKRYVIISELDDNYDLKMDPKYTDRLDIAHNTAYITEYGEEAFNVMLSEFETETGQDDQGKLLLTCRLTNKTPYTFKGLGMSFGICPEEDPNNFAWIERRVVTSWQPGEVITFEAGEDRLKELGFEYGDGKGNKFFFKAN